MFAAVWGCTLPYLVALVETCSLAHGSCCEHELGFTSPFTCKMNGDFLKTHTFYLLNPSLAWTPLCGNKSPWLAPICPSFHSPQFKAASGQLQRIHFKGFRQTQNSQAEVGVCSFGRASGALASWGALFSFPVIHSGQMWAAFMGGMRAAFTPHLDCAARGEGGCER